MLIFDKELKALPALAASGRPHSLHGRPSRSTLAMVLGVHPGQSSPPDPGAPSLEGSEGPERRRERAPLAGGTMQSLEGQ